ncbi:toll/interleukin-1 receptor domain-containing protein [Vallitalea okinawensis]|uniref:toll/interleukin-1 receptor domain-containing protein n=1 Tax=Vallitalea okinawensis TaxID=2078660 RepID=UPI000CFB1390|nr:toll/interleukin-1 receptor domain-containing protein [Vallitalea okinawensis]
MNIPKTFISYSHDSQEHKKWVLDLATRLRYTGVDAIIDQWELKAGDDIPSFMEKNLNNADYILMICTERYVEKANFGSGGVGYEKMIITSELLSDIDNNKVIPIIRQYGTYHVPTFLKTKMFIDFSNDDSFEYSFDELIRRLHNSPLFEKPEIGNNPFQPINESRPNRKGDTLLELMKIVVNHFELSTKDYMDYEFIVREMGVSRIYLDLVIEEAIDEGLVEQSSYKSLYITNKGKQYAIQHKLVVV